jgi:predicted  nucleic acid-binding Zn-ribbon protein
MPSMLTACALLPFALAAQGNRNDATQLRTGSQSFISALEFQQSLRVCNAYPYNAALDLFIGKAKLNAEPLGYKQCQEFKQKLESGAKVDFNVGESTVGTFTITDLPQSDAVLGLVVFRHDAISTAVSFESHVFADSDQPQVAVIDTYRGPREEAEAEVRIEDHADAVSGNATARSEVLRFNTVVAVSPGRYEVELRDSKGRPSARNELVTAAHESYMVLRVGVNARQGQDYGQELVVFPETPAPSEVKSGAMAAGGFGSVVVALLAHVAMQGF